VFVWLLYKRQVPHSEVAMFVYVIYFLKGKSLLIITIIL